MTMHRTHIWSLAAGVALAGGLLAQNSGVTRTPVYKGEVSVPGREAVVARVEIAPGSEAGRHTHPGDEISYVLEGEVDVTIDGQATQHFKAGDGFSIPGGKVHNARNNGKVPVKLAGIYVVEKGQPLATPAK
jgi:quercetin dioxygenase-like cupin family protein